MHLHEFITSNYSALIARTGEKVAQRPWPPVSPEEMEHGIPLFLTQIAETLRLEGTEAPFPTTAIGSAATKHGGDLLALGFTMSQVVHDYGDVSQAITGLAFEQKATISAEEFQTMNRCLDNAIATAVTEYGRLQEGAATEAGRVKMEAATEAGRLQQETSSREEVERLGYLAHELRNKLHTALLSFEALKTGRVSVAGSTGAVLGRSLIGLRDLIDRTLAEVRLDVGTEQRERVLLSVFIREVAVAANLHAESRDIRLTVASVELALAVTVDPHLLASAVMNLLQNAIKYTRLCGLVTLRTRAEDGRVFIEIEDECGGFATSETEPQMFQTFGERRKSDRSGLGLGLSISRRAVQACGGEIRASNIPGQGCIFTIDLPSAA